MIPRLPFLETMITQACNLSCQGCTNYSDLKHTGYVSWQQGKAWLADWNKRLIIEDFGIMGGEPLINPELEQWLIGTRQLLPESQIRLTTNGLLLWKYPDLIDLCQSLGNVVFKITVHVADQRLEEEIIKIKERITWQSVTEHGIKRWRSTSGLRLQINRPTRFLRPFRNSYLDMAPWQSDPQDAFDQCIQQTCPLLYRGRIYKCSTSALLLDTLERSHNPNWDAWQPYVSHGIGIDASDDDVQCFLDEFGKPTSICGQCPGKNAPAIDHLLAVQTRKT